MAPKLQDGLRQFADHPLVGEIRGVGLVAGVEIVQDKATKAAFDPKKTVGVYFQDRIQEEGLIVRAIGDTIAFSPPLIINEAEIGEMLDCFEKGLEKTWVWVRENGLSAA